MIEDHKIANTFPLMRKPALDELVADIEENGLRDKITIFEGKILDGRNRYRAMLRLDPKFSVKTAPKMFIEFDGGDPIEFVVSKNLHRRHLTTSQRAMIAAELSIANPQTRHKKGILTADAAQMMGVSTGIAFAARSLIKNKSPKVAKIKAGRALVGSWKQCGVSFTLPQELADAFEVRCEQCGRSKSDVLRGLIERFLKRPFPPSGRPLTESGQSTGTAGP